MPINLAIEDAQIIADITDCSGWYINLEQATCTLENVLSESNLYLDYDDTGSFNDPDGLKYVPIINGWDEQLALIRVAWYTNDDRNARISVGFV